jgi:hypothetical protein
MALDVRRRVGWICSPGLAPAAAQNIVVDAAPGHAVNSFSPPRALGGAIDRLRVKRIVVAGVGLGQKDPAGNLLVTAYGLERPGGQWSVMLVNKDPDNRHAVKVSFAGDAGRTHGFSGTVDRVVFGAAEYQWRPDPVPPGSTPPAGRGGGRSLAACHPDPDGPPLKSTVTGDGPATLYELPKASIVVLRGRMSN